jgi:predicted  nucleic acid-binding Zn-ribbon protein
MEDWKARHATLQAAYDALNTRFMDNLALHSKSAQARIRDVLQKEARNATIKAMDAKLEAAALKEEVARLQAELDATKETLAEVREKAAHVAKTEDSNRVRQLERALSDSAQVAKEAKAESACLRLELDRAQILASSGDAGPEHLRTFAKNQRLRSPLIETIAESNQPLHRLIRQIAQIAVSTDPKTVGAPVARNMLKTAFGG